MHSTDTKSQFIELRAKNWSLARIATHLKVAPRTLVEWNRQSQAEIRLLRAVQLEAIQEKILATHEQELTSLVQHLKRLDEEAATRKVQFVETKALFAGAGRDSQDASGTGAGRGRPASSSHHTEPMKPLPQPSSHSKTFNLAKNCTVSASLLPHETS